MPQTRTKGNSSPLLVDGHYADRLGVGGEDLSFAHGDLALDGIDPVDETVKAGGAGLLELGGLVREGLKIGLALQPSGKCGAEIHDPAVLQDLPHEGGQRPVGGLFLPQPEPVPHPAAAVPKILVPALLSVEPERRAVGPSLLCARRQILAAGEDPDLSQIFGGKAEGREMQDADQGEIVSGIVYEP